MVRGVTAIAQGDQVGGVVGSAGSARNQVMDVGFALGALLPTRSACMRVASEDDGANRGAIAPGLFGQRKET
jgi:hypothetical protein